MYGYLLTWTTYGTWLQGDRRGWVKDGVIYEGQAKLEQVNRDSMKNEAVILNHEQQGMVYEAILRHGGECGQSIAALAVTGNHVHLLLRGVEEAGRSAARYKNVGRRALGRAFVKREVWTKGFHKRFVMTNEQMQAMMRYIGKHEAITAWVYVG